MHQLVCGLASVSSGGYIGPWGVCGRDARSLRHAGTHTPTILVSHLGNVVPQQGTAPAAAAIHNKYAAVTRLLKCLGKRWYIWGAYLWMGASMDMHGWGVQCAVAVCGCRLQDAYLAHERVVFIALDGGHLSAKACAAAKVTARAGCSRDDMHGGVR
jgi:hypothetical protein